MLLFLRVSGRWRGRGSEEKFILIFCPEIPYILTNRSDTVPAGGECEAGTELKSFSNSVIVVSHVHTDTSTLDWSRRVEQQ